MAKISIGTIQQNIVKETAIGEVEAALTALDEPVDDGIFHRIGKALGISVG